ncbi:UNVERIFIED_CONTAM: hypothetical protein GTU68_051610 [Idotea baltica]|nr:hypothetical protein [Idotea baltica]
MISRSVPGYRQILQLLPSLVKQLSKTEGDYYDLGCSLGAGMLSIAQGLITDIDDQKHNIIGIDSSAAMLAQAESIFAKADYSNINFEFRCADINTIETNNAAMVLMNFTLQFIPLDKRDALIQAIFSNLNVGGGLVISEKIKFDDLTTNQTLIDIHHQFKADQGYSQLEISQKRDAIDDVLIPETLDAHLERLTSAGFKVVTPWIQNLQFISILAIK